MFAPSSAIKPSAVDIVARINVTRSPTHFTILDCNTNPRMADTAKQTRRPPVSNTNHP